MLLTGVEVGEQGLLILGRMHPGQLATIAVFLPLILPLALSWACLEVGSGVKSISNHNQSRSKLWRRLRLSRRNSASLPRRSCSMLSALKASRVRATLA